MKKEANDSKSRGMRKEVKPAKAENNVKGLMKLKGVKKK